VFGLLSWSEKEIFVPSPSAVRVLLVDDNLDAAESLALLLQLDGHEVRLAHEGEQALEVAKTFEPQLVLLDIGLPGLDGYEVARRLRATPHGASTRLVALTGYGQAGDREKSTAAGFDEHLVKPMDPAQLGRLIASVDLPGRGASKSRANS
jgi:two-component system, OmpR family, response regulator